MKKRIVSFLVMATLVFSFTGCSSVKTENKNSESKDNFIEYKTELQEAVDNLNVCESNYMISNILESPQGTTCYIENYSTAGYSFTEYPMDKEGNLGQLQLTGDEEEGDIDYLTTDWITEDGKMYLNNSQDASKAEYYKMPDTYADICKSRNVMYMDTMLKDFIEITKEETTSEVDLGEIDKVELTMYKCVLPKEKVKNYLAVGSLALYESMKADEATSDSVKKLCDYYIKDLNETMYFSNANVYVGVDANKVLRTYSLEVGGLGSRMYLTKTVLFNGYQDLKQPDFKNVSNYCDTLTDLAEYLEETGEDYGKAITKLYHDGTKIESIGDTETIEE